MARPDSATPGSGATAKGAPVSCNASARAAAAHDAGPTATWATTGVSAAPAGRPQERSASVSSASSPVPAGTSPPAGSGAVRPGLPAPKPPASDATAPAAPAAPVLALLAPAAAASKAERRGPEPRSRSTTRAAPCRCAAAVEWARSASGASRSASPRSTDVAAGAGSACGSSSQPSNGETPGSPTGRAGASRTPRPPGSLDGPPTEPVCPARPWPRAARSGSELPSTRPALVRSEQWGRPRSATALARTSDGAAPEWSSASTSRRTAAGTAAVPSAWCWRSPQSRR